MASSIMPNRPKSILIIRLSAIGDIVMASGVLPVLRSNWPETQIDWLVQSEYAELLQDNPHLQRVLIWPRKDWQWLWTQKRPFSLIAELRKLIQTLRSQKYDLVLDLQGLWKSAWLAKVCRAQQKIGLDSREGSKWVMSHVCRSQPDKQKMSSE
ncbi:MAG: glycosyltransferase family 9 protein, partial [Desulfohalobiaceae bacterium]